MERIVELLTHVRLYGDFGRTTNDWITETLNEINELETL